MNKKMLAMLVLLVIVVIIVLFMSIKDDASTDKKYEVKEDSYNKENINKEPVNKEHIEENSQDIIIKKQVILDNEFVNVIVNDIEENEEFFELLTDIKNKINSKLTLSIGKITEDWCSVNGYMLENCFFIEDIASGSKISGNIKLDKSELRFYGVEELADIQFRFLGVDNNSLLRGFESDIIKISTSIVEKYDYEKDTYLENLKNSEIMSELGYNVKYLEENVFEENGIKIVSQSILEDKDGRQNIFIEFENDTDKLLSGEISTITLNGLELNKDGNNTVIINPYARSVVKYSLDRLSGLEDKEITGIKVIEEFEYEFEFDNVNVREKIASGRIKMQVK